MKALFQFDLFGAGQVLALRLAKRVVRQAARARNAFNAAQLDLFASLHKLGQKGVNALKRGTSLLLVCSRARVTFAFRAGARFFFEDAAGCLHVVSLTTLRETLVFGGVA